MLDIDIVEQVDCDLCQEIKDCIDYNFSGRYCYFCLHK